MQITSERINNKNIDKIIAAVLPYEQLCINLTSILKRQKNIYTQKETLTAFSNAIAFFKDNKVSGIVIISLRGVVLHCFFEKISQSETALLLDFFSLQPNLSSVMGEKNNSILLEEIIFKSRLQKIIHSEDYNLLTLKKDEPDFPTKDFFSYACKNLNEELEFLIPEKKDLKNLIPLEIDYQNTEVLINNEKADFNFCKSILEGYIKKKKLYAIKSKENYYSKATINAEGFFWNQIGGVYTVPSKRCRGLGAAIVYQVINVYRPINDYQSVNYKNRNSNNFALFVKTKNKPALKMYQNLGFKKFCDFRISYF